MSAGPKTAVTQHSSGSYQPPEFSQRTSGLPDGVQPSADQPVIGINQSPQTGELADTPPQTEQAEIKFEDMLKVIRSFEEEYGDNESLWPPTMDVLFYQELPRAAKRLEQNPQDRQAANDVVNIVRQLYDHAQRNLAKTLP